MRYAIALKILDQVRQSYDKIAEDFSQTRKSVWEEFKPLADYVKMGDKVLDLGCGNGRLVDLFKGRPIEYFGIDNSQKLIEIAKKRYPTQEFQIFDGLKIPFEDNYFDKVFCISVLFHIPSKELREEFLKEVKRVLRPDGMLILSVWYMWPQGSFWPLFLKFTLKKLFCKSQLDFFDTMKPWGGISERYFHNFRKGELKKLVLKIGFNIDKFGILRRGPKNKNLLVIAKK